LVTSTVFDIIIIQYYVCDVVCDVAVCDVVVCDVVVVSPLLLRLLLLLLLLCTRTTNDE